MWLSPMEETIVGFLFLLLVTDFVTGGSVNIQLKIQRHQQTVEKKQGRIPETGVIKKTCSGMKRSA